MRENEETMFGHIRDQKQQEYDDGWKGIKRRDEDKKVNDD